MYLISIGQQAARVASHFQGMNKSFKLTKIGVDSEEYTVCIPSQLSPEDYENKTDFNIFSRLFSSIEDNEENNIIVAVSGEFVSAITLRLLKEITRENRKITIIYLQPNFNFSTEVVKKHSRVLSGVLQEYARSGMLNDLYLFDYAILDELLIDSPIPYYEEKKAQMVAHSFTSIMAMSNNLENIHVDRRSEVSEHQRIKTIGTIDSDLKEEHLFYPMQEIENKIYYFGVSEKTMQGDKELLAKVNKFVIDRKKTGQESSFAIYSSPTEYDLYYAVYYTGEVQNVGL